MAETQNESIAATYAKALLATTEKAGVTATVLTELESLVRDVLGHQPKFTEALASPRIASEQKLQLIDHACGGRMSSELVRFLKVVARQGRFALMPAIAASYRKQVNDQAGRAEVTVVTAAAMTDDLLDRVKQTLESHLKRPIDLQTEINDALIGGMVVRVGDTVYDASIAGKLNRMRKTEVKNTAAKLQKS